MRERSVGRWSSSHARRKPRGSLRVRRLSRSSASPMSAHDFSGVSRTGSRFQGVRRVPSRALERRSSAEARRRNVRAASSSTGRRGGTSSETSRGSKQFRGSYGPSGHAYVTYRTRADRAAQRATTIHGFTLRAFSSSWSKYRIRPAAEWKPESRSRAMRDPIDQGISVLKRFRAEWRIWKTCSERLNTTPANSALSRWGRFTVDPGVVYIAKEPTMNYILAVCTPCHGRSHDGVVPPRRRSTFRALQFLEH